MIIPPPPRSGTQLRLPILDDAPAMLPGPGPRRDCAAELLCLDAALVRYGEGYYNVREAERTGVHPTARNAVHCPEGCRHFVDPRAERFAEATRRRTAQGEA